MLCHVLQLAAASEHLTEDQHVLNLSSPSC